MPIHCRTVTDLVPCLADLDVKPIPLHLGKPKAGIKTGAGG